MSLGNGPGGEVFPKVDDEERSFEDLERQNLHFHFTVDFTNNRSGTDLPANGRGGGTGAVTEPLNGRLNSNQVAELVGIWVSGFQVYPEKYSGGGTTVGQCRGEGQINVQPRRQELDSPSRGGLSGAELTGQGDLDTGSDELQREDAYSEVTERQLWFGFAHTSQGYKDTANGTGGGISTDQSANAGERYFRGSDRPFGRGPILEHDDRMNWTWGISWSYWSNEAVNIEARYYMLWDVFEREMGDLREAQFNL